MEINMTRLLVKAARTRGPRVDVCRVRQTYEP